MLAKKLKRLIKQECVTLMQTNLADALEKATDRNPLFSNPDFLDASLESWREELRMSAYIFGDSYAGMPQVELERLLANEDFKLAESEQYQGKEILAYVHQYLKIMLVAVLQADRLVHMDLNFKLRVNARSVTPGSLCGMGMTRMHIDLDGGGDLDQDAPATGVMTGKMDVTGGLSNKIYVLKSFVTSDQLEESSVGQ
jgi:hypothetical protein